MLIDLVLMTAALPSVPVSIAPEPVIEMETNDLEAKPVKWTGTVTIGASYSDGNTDKRTLNGAADAERRAEKDRWTAKGWWNYSEERDSTGEMGISQRRSGASLKYDYFLSKKMYLFGLAAAESDLEADIKLRTYYGAGVGYQWREDDKLKWGSEAGLTYFDTDYYESEDRGYLAARIANNIAWQISETTKFENSVELFPSLEDKEDFYGKSDTKIKTNLTKSMFAQLQWVYQYTAIPADGAERNDNLVILGVGWSF